MPHLFLLVSVVCGVLVLYPYTIYPFILRYFVKQMPPSRASIPSGPFPSVDIVFCVYNEESCLEDKLGNCLTLADRYGARVHVYSDGSTDRTAAILADYSSRCDVILNPHRRGKTAGMNELIARSNGELIAFTDANVIIDPAHFANIQKHFADASVGCITGHLIYTNSDDGGIADVGARYWSFEERLKTLESASGSTVGADGSLFVIRRHLYREVPTDIIDDMFTSVSILCDGLRVIQVNDVIAFERTSTRTKEEFRRKVRIACRCFNCQRLLWRRIRKLDGLNQFKYLSHKLLRWLGGVWLICGTVAWLSFCASIGSGALAVISIGGILLVLTAPRLKVSQLVRIREAVFSIIAASYGVWRSLRGERFQTWTAAQSTRIVRREEQAS